MRVGGGAEAAEEDEGVSKEKVIEGVRLLLLLVLLVLPLLLIAIGVG